MDITTILIILAFIAIVWGIAQFIKKIANQYPSAAPDQSPISGVGGLLLVLIFILIIIPIRELSSLNTTFLALEMQYPAFKEIEGYNIYKTVSWWTYILTCFLNIYAGVGLVSGRKKQVVNRAIIILWVTGPFTYLFMEVILPALAFGKSELDIEGIGRILASALVAAIWTSYLLISKRVRATYGFNMQKNSIIAAKEEETEKKIIEQDDAVSDVQN